MVKNVSIKSERDVQGMRIAGRLAAEVLDMIDGYVQPGISTGRLNQICHNYIVEEQGAIPAPLNYRGFPKSICTSINNVICHGIPDDKKILKKGDIINIDITVIKDGYYGDTSKMFTIGKVAPFAQRLIGITQECLYQSIRLVKPGTRLGDIGHCIQSIAEPQGFSVVRDFCGHGIGKTFHEPPDVLHYGTKDTGLALQEGMTFTIEPMINAGSYKARVLADGWTAVTADRKLSAQWEHTLLVTSDGVEVLTLRDEERLNFTPML